MNHKKEKATHRQDKSLSHVAGLKYSITLIFTQFSPKTAFLKKPTGFRFKGGSV